jgi:hypothetical protein
MDRNVGQCTTLNQTAEAQQGQLWEARRLKRDGYSITLIQNTESSSMKHNSVCSEKLGVRNDFVTAWH